MQSKNKKYYSIIIIIRYFLKYLTKLIFLRNMKGIISLYYLHDNQM